MLAWQFLAWQIGTGHTRNCNVGIGLDNMTGKSGNMKQILQDSLIHRKLPIRFDAACMDSSVFFDCLHGAALG